MLASWLFCFFWHSLSLIEYEYEVLSVVTCAMVLGSLFAFVVGSFVSVRVRFSRQSARTDEAFDWIPPLVLIVLLVATLAFAGGIATKWRQFSSGYSLETARQLHWENAESFRHSPLSLMMSVARPCAMFLVLSFPLYWKNSRLYAFLSASAGALFVLEDMAEGGRSFTAFAIVGCFFAGLLVVEHYRPHIFRQQAVFRLLLSWKLYVVALGIFLMAYLLFGVFPVARNPHAALRVDKYVHMHLGSRTSIGTHVNNLSATFDRPDIRHFAYGTGYLTAPLMRMNYLMNESDATRWYFMGGNNFTLLSKVANLFLQRDGYSLKDVKKRIASAQPYGENPWISGVMEVVIDFGVVGCFVFMAVAGWLCSACYHSALETRRQEWYVLYALLAVIIISFPYASRLRTNAFGLTSLLCFALILVRNIRLTPRPIAKARDEEFMPS